MAVVVVNGHVVLNETERVVLLHTFYGASGCFVIEIKGGMVEGTYTHKFLVDIVKASLGIGYRTA